MKRAGFSLVELAVVLIILALAATQAMPAYQQHVIRTRRNEGQAALMRLMMQQERFHTQYNRYIAFSANAIEPEAQHFRWWSGANPKSSAYEVEGKACEDEPIALCIQIVAKPGTELVDKRFRDESCGTLTLTSTGLRLAAGPATGCWP
ncbi:type IV pilin protein [Duganella sp. P38]|uniref:type IV pilin protein n=1 Tax=Duganella sp. P38 TaxID=3423949 RepID=UPI003D78D77E